MSDRNITVLYGSQTGTAQEEAERIVRDAKRMHFRTKLCSLDEFDVRQLPTLNLAVFVVATTGQGDPPDNMVRFWRFLLRKDLPKDSLSSLEFAVLGLGDSSYQKYNFMGKRLYRRLLQLGANNVYRRGDADDQHPLGPDGEIVPWLEGLWTEILNKYPLPAGYEIIPPGQLQDPRFKITTANQDSVKLSGRPVYKDINDSNKKNPSFNKFQPYASRLTQNERITASDHWQDVRHVEMDIAESGISYHAGDILGMWPKNQESNVDRLLKRLNLDGEEPIFIEAIDPDAPTTNLPISREYSITWRTLFTEYLDIQGSPRRYFFELLSHFTDSELEKDRLEYFGSAEGADDMRRYNHREKRTIVEVLEDFSSVQPPRDYILELIPPLQPRLFSIASSPSHHQDKIQLSVAVVNFKTPFGRRRTGTCTSWLQDLPLGSCIPIWTRSGTMSLPSDLEKPIVLVGPGTGVAPFRSILWERYEFAVKNLESESKLGDAILFFGNRKKDQDYLYHEEWQYLKNEKDKFPFQLFTAFSRDGSSKYYVQHAIKDNAQIVYDKIVNENGYFYVAGNANQMPKDVRNALIHVLQIKGDMSQDNAEKYVREMEKKLRYQCETWS
eukprot:gb/GECH01002366.1/.p1 GENE.gb/GECH01002366.1/~~gb/GECH01002366.1/.p1  ORF type:complete len:612 (+),score=138.92 gb/GECH01002366.1/:1-1836(+)